MDTQFYTLKTKSNTHVGSGQNSYGIVDNVVQKDYLSELPCIFSTSLKGALREYAKFKKWSDDDIVSVFGSSPNEKKSDNLKQGSHYFNQAHLLSFPMRSNKLQYFNVTCPNLLETFKELLPETATKLKTEIKDLLENNVVKTIKPNSPISDLHNDYIIEKHSIKTTLKTNVFSTKLKEILGENLVIMHNDTFKSIVQKLPIITRNQLENGQSGNLFYEEVIVYPIV